MKITNQQVINSLTALHILDACKLTVKGAFAMRKNRVKLVAEAKGINDAHAEIFRKYFGNLTQADEKHTQWPNFKREADELMTVLREVEPQKIQMKDILESAPGLIKALDDLDWLIEDGA